MKIIILAIFFFMIGCYQSNNRGDNYSKTSSPEMMMDGSPKLAMSLPGEALPAEAPVVGGEKKSEEIAKKDFNTESYDHIVENEFLSVQQNPLSTFSIDVDTASYANVRRFLNYNMFPKQIGRAHV